jgi:hypothetical protein
MTELTPIPSYFSGFRTLADGTWRITVDTQELAEHEANDIVHNVRKSGYFLFIPNNEKVDVDSLNLPEAAPEYKGDKTPGQRLRGILYRLWESLGAKGTFEEFYRIKMEEICNHFKAKLDQ